MMDQEIAELTFMLSRLEDMILVSHKQSLRTDPFERTKVRSVSTLTSGLV